MDDSHSRTYQYRNVMRWSRRVHNSDLFQLGKIFFPCHISQSHWSCVIVNVSSCTITYHDSMRGNGDRFMHHILHYLQDDWMRTKGFEMPDLRQWTIQNDRHAPSQDNSYDCGVFLCMFATCMALDCEMDFSQADAHIMRLKLARFVYDHRTQHNRTTMATEHPSVTEAMKTPSTTNAHAISQASSTASSATTSISQPLSNTGYLTIMNNSNIFKRKFNANHKESIRKKRRLQSTSHSKGCNNSTSGADTQIQAKITDTISSTNATQRKRKLSITDEEHPYKHRRFKKKDDP
jgi:hypothetical protein